MRQNSQEYLFRTPPVAWVTESMKAIMRDSDYACTKTNTSCSNVQGINLYRMLRNICSKLIYSEKYHYFNYRVNKNMKNPRKMRSEINKILGISIQNVTPSCIRNPYKNK